MNHTLYTDFVSSSHRTEMSKAGFHSLCIIFSVRWFSVREAVVSIIRHTAAHWYLIPIELPLLP